jgi:hypothetical protein
MPTFHDVDTPESLAVPRETYTGQTTDLRRRLTEHNSGKVHHTSKYRPWITQAEHEAILAREPDPELHAYYAKGDAGKVAVAARLRAETTMTVGWIAERLGMGTRGHLNRTTSCIAGGSPKANNQELTPFS